MDLRMQHLVRAGGREVFDLEATLARLGGERMVLRRVLHQFALDLAEWEPSLMALRGAADAAALCQLAHAIKSAAASAGAVRLHAAAQALEAGLRAGSAVPPGELADACRSEFRRASTALREQLAGMP